MPVTSIAFASSHHYHRIRRQKLRLQAMQPLNPEPAVTRSKANISRPHKCLPPNTATRIEPPLCINGSCRPLTILPRSSCRNKDVAASVCVPEVRSAAPAASRQKWHDALGNKHIPGPRLPRAANLQSPRSSSSGTVDVETNCYDAGFSTSAILAWFLLSR